MLFCWYFDLVLRKQFVIYSHWFNLVLTFFWRLNKFCFQNFFIFLFFSFFQQNGVFCLKHGKFFFSILLPKTYSKFVRKNLLRKFVLFLFYLYVVFSVILWLLFSYFFFLYLPSYDGNVYFFKFGKFLKNNGLNLEKLWKKILANEENNVILLTDFLCFIKFYNCN